jgi:hypothetical protein
MAGLKTSKKARVGEALGSQYLKLKALYEALGGYEVGRVDKAVALRIAGDKIL